MSSLILHHYPMSPFSEKIRSMLGCAQLPWQSAITREMPPRPMVAKLAGGYRKIPVAQMGADIFCDSRVIASEIAALGNKPQLALENCSTEIQAFVQEVDLDLFFAFVMTGGSKKLQQKVRENMGWLDIARFAWDRINMGRKAAVKMVGPGAARPMVIKHLQRMETILQQDFLFGSEPCHADFSAYHGLWFIRDLGERSFIQDYPATIAWMDRMKAFGHGNCTNISAVSAHAQAKAAQPRPIAPEYQQEGLIGKQVSVAPSDYGLDATKGKLVGSLPHRWIIAREDKDLGTLHVHFPKTGFSLRSV